MKRIFTFLLAAASVATVNAQDCSDVFISEYVEGESTNKALELYNPTGSTIDLSGYFVTRYSGSAGSTAFVKNSVQLTGTIDAYSTYVGVLDKRDPSGTGTDAPIDPALEAKGDGFYSPDYDASNAFYWNGDDAIVLYKGILTADPDQNVATISPLAIVDVFGKPGEDPGVAWTTEAPYNGPGAWVTKDYSLIRKNSILKGSTDFLPTFFNPLEEWDSIPAEIIVGMDTVGNWASLGVHDCNCAASINENVSVDFNVYPNPNNGTFTLNSIENIKNVSILSLDGKIILTRSNVLAGSNELISIKEDGLFIITIETDEGAIGRKRIVIKK